MPRCAHSTIALLLVTFAPGCTPNLQMIDPWGPPEVFAELWNPQTRVFQWWEGSIQLPEGYSYHRMYGTDSFVGRFESPDGSIVLRHDIFGCIEEESPNPLEESARGCGTIYPGQKGSARNNPQNGVFEAWLHCGASSFFVLRSVDRASLNVLEEIAKSYRPPPSRTQPRDRRAHGLESR